MAALSKTARWAYTAKCTIWRDLGTAENGDDLGWSEPEIFMCEYQGGLSAKIGNIGTEITAKNTFWTELSTASIGDYVLIGVSDNPEPLDAGADRVMTVLRYADSFYRQADDFAIITGV